jgi:hypothetical protein
MGALAQLRGRLPRSASPLWVISGHQSGDGDSPLTATSGRRDFGLTHNLRLRCFGCSAPDLHRPFSHSHAGPAGVILTNKFTASALKGGPDRPHCTWPKRPRAQIGQRCARTPVRRRPNHARPKPMQRGPFGTVPSAIRNPVPIALAHCGPCEHRNVVLMAGPTQSEDAIDSEGNV